MTNSKKISAIICEFNPLHTGHKKLIDYAKSISDFVVCIMSGNFVERGMPACAEKHQRATHAILSGADLVLELPTVFATASAENFAYGGVAIAKMIGADYLVFGSECGNIDELEKASELLDDAEINAKIHDEMEKGNNYPKAVANAIGSDIFSSPNNTLAIEYLRAIRKLDANITPITIKRPNNYNSEFSDEFASSTALRNDKTLLNKYSFDYVAKDVNCEVETKYCDFAVKHIALLDKEYLANIEGVTEGIENRIANAKATTYEQLMEQIKTKRYTRLKLQRIILNSILGITKQDVINAKENITTNVLAVSENATELLQLVESVKNNTTEKADKLYYSLTGIIPPQKLIKIK